MPVNGNRSTAAAWRGPFELDREFVREQVDASRSNSAYAVTTAPCGEALDHVRPRDIQLAHSLVPSLTHPARVLRIGVQAVDRLRHPDGLLLDHEARYAVLDQRASRRNRDT